MSTRKGSGGGYIDRIKSIRLASAGIVRRTLYTGSYEETGLAWRDLCRVTHVCPVWYMGEGDITELGLMHVDTKIVGVRLIHDRHESILPDAMSVGQVIMCVHREISTEMEETYTTELVYDSSIPTSAIAGSTIMDMQDLSVYVCSILHHSAE